MDKCDGFSSDNSGTPLGSLLTGVEIVGRFSQNLIPQRVLRLAQIPLAFCVWMWIIRHAGLGFDVKASPMRLHGVRNLARAI